MFVQVHTYANPVICERMNIKKWEARRNVHSTFSTPDRK